MKTANQHLGIAPSHGYGQPVAQVLPKLTDLTQPLQQLLSRNSPRLWGPDQDQAFANIKAELTKPSVLTLYNPLAPTKVCADASFYGLGAVLMLKNDSQ